MESNTNSRSPRAGNEILRICEELVGGQRSPLSAARLIAGLRFDLDPDQEDADLLTFAGIESQEDHLPVYDSLRGWHPAVEEAKKAEVAEAEEFHRATALASARRIIARYGGWISRDSA